MPMDDPKPEFACHGLKTKSNHKNRDLQDCWAKNSNKIPKYFKIHITCSNEYSQEGE